MRRVKSKSGKIYVYENYKHKSTRSKVLVSKSGRVNYKNVKEYVNKIMNSDMSDNDKRSILNKLDIEIEDRRRSGPNKNKGLTINGFENIRHAGYTEQEQMFANAGWDLEDVAAEYDIDETALRNPKNWNGSKFTWNGKTWQFKFSYTGDILVDA